jgi:hypothetical protein
VEEWEGPEDLRGTVLRRIHRQIDTNKRDLRSAHVVFAIPQQGMGGEMFCEVARALEWGIPVVWVAQPRVILSAYDEGVGRVPAVSDGLTFLGVLARMVRWSPSVSDERVREMLWTLICFFEYEREAGRLRLPEPILCPPEGLE